MTVAKGDPFVADEIFPADVAIVFGMTGWQRPCARATDLYRAGFARKLLFTGGYNATAGVVEAGAMAECAQAKGVPVQNILIEPEAGHTVANVRNAVDCIERSIGIANVDTVLLVAIHFHMRRVKAIAGAIFPGRIRIGCASYPSIHYTSANWQQSDRGRADVASEARKLQSFLRTGDGAQLRR